MKLFRRRIRPCPPSAASKARPVAPPALVGLQDWLQTCDAVLRGPCASLEAKRSQGALDPIDVELMLARAKVLARAGRWTPQPSSPRPPRPRAYQPARSPERSRHIPAALRRSVMERDGGLCQHCGTDQNPSLDHIFPFSKGGLHTLGNLQVLCRSCNSRKHDRVPVEV